VGFSLIDLEKSIQIIEINKDKIPYSFTIKLVDRTYKFTFRWNDLGGFYTCDLESSRDGLLCYGDILRYGRPMFNSVEDERYPISVIIPYCFSGDEVYEITKENFGKQVRLYLYERRDAQ
jgi:hypothetical protein